MSLLSSQEVGDGGRPSGVGGYGSPVCPLSGRGRRETYQGQMVHLCARCQEGGEGGPNGGKWLTCVPWQFSAHPHVPLTSLQVVYGADVVQASTGNIVPGWGIGTSHHPGRPQRNGMHLPHKQCPEAWGSLWGKDYKVFSAPLNLRRMRQALLEIRHSEEQAGAWERTWKHHRHIGWMPLSVLAGHLYLKCSF